MKEQELKSFYKENTGSKIEAFAIVDLDNQFTFALKVGSDDIDISNKIAICQKCKHSLKHLCNHTDS